MTITNQLKVVKRAWEVWNIYDNHIAYSPEIVYATNALSARKKLEDLNSDCRFKDNAAKRCLKMDMVEFDGETVERRRAKELEIRKQRLLKINELDESDTYLVQNGYSGNAILFWAKGCAGYTPNLENAHQFSKDELLKCFGLDIREDEIIWPYKECAEGKITVVDSQYLDYSKKI